MRPRIRPRLLLEQRILGGSGRIRGPTFADLVLKVLLLHSNIVSGYRLRNATRAGT